MSKTNRPFGIGGSTTPFDVFQQGMAYQVDSWQRSILFWDVMRKRGNEYNEHVKAGKPPVLHFDYDVIVDGVDLPRPCNYLLLHIRPPEGVELDPRRRPFVVIDPRAGHGPGIGGMKEASQVGVALRAGHPVYFIAFKPEPVPGQTLFDVAVAEKTFLETVIERHPESESKPAVLGNCQAGWALMMLAAHAPDVHSILSISGAPLSYWAGVRGKNPMRYTGGLVGGTWPAIFLGDIGNGVFDGSWLVTNFEQMNPANTYWTKNYNLYSKVDTEEERFLDFERWWGGHFFLNTEEIQAIVSELFVGNKLAQGKIVAPDGDKIDLMRIKSPIVVICSWGDNITPPQQALNWILDLYDGTDEIRATEQTIVYTIHDTIGHLGIFVSSRVALKEHAEFVSCIEQIETLPPGLYEMVIEDVRIESHAVGETHEAFTVRFEQRTLDDIRKLDDGRGDEEPFEAVRRASEINEGLYETFLRPWVKAMTTAQGAKLIREMHPDRVQRRVLSDANPFVRPLSLWADWVKANRQPVDRDNFFVKMERAFGENVVRVLDAYRDHRDRQCEAMFEAMWTNPAVRAFTGIEAPFVDEKMPRASLRADMKAWVDMKLAGLKSRCHEGGFDAGLIRLILAGIDAMGSADARSARIARNIAKRDGIGEGMTRADLLKLVKEEAFLLQFDREHAMATLPDLLQTRAERERALQIFKEIQSWRPEMLPQAQAVLEEVEAILGLDRPANDQIARTVA